MIFTETYHYLISGVKMYPSIITPLYFLFFKNIIPQKQQLSYQNAQNCTIGGTECQFDTLQYLNFSSQEFFDGKRLNGIQ